jgi:hypothetical protein
LVAGSLNAFAHSLVCGFRREKMNRYWRRQPHHLIVRKTAALFAGTLYAILD